MKTITITVFTLLALFGFHGVAAAQASMTRMAYDQCRADPGAWDVTCTVAIVVDGHDTVVANGIAPKWSPDASKIAFTGPPDPSEPYWMWSSLSAVLVLNVADGSIIALTDSASNNFAPVWSPDGSKIAFVSQRDGSNELYVMDANGANPRRVTQNAGFACVFGWSPDNRLAFLSDRDGAPELYVIDADGSNLTRLTTNVGVTGQFAWSFDGHRITFDCVMNGNADICAINDDGTNFVRLTSDPAKDSGAVFSPVDGRIAFVTERFGPAEIAVMDADGTVTRVAAGTGGRQPVWAADGGRLAFGTTTPSFYTGTCYFGGGAHNADDFCVPVYGIDLVNADGTGLTAIASGDSPDWFRSLPGQPVAAFTYQCSGVACDFDAAGSFDPDGTIASHEWRFGDGTTGSGPTAHHVYTTGNTYGVALIVTDNSGATGMARIGVGANTAPIASFTVNCNGPTCAFDGSGSSDPDGTIARYEWFFGDDNWGGTAPTAEHTYRTGTYAATLIVTDNGGVSNTMVTTVSVVNAPPAAAFTSTCNGMTCTFDGSASSDPDGPIVYYSWTFGDGTRGDGAIVSHTFAAGSTYTVTLVVDDLYGTASQSQAVTIGGVNAPPVASFTSACDQRMCNFNASASSDADGVIASYAFNFGDGTTWIGTGYGPFHQYAADGTYTVTLTVTDNGGLTAQTNHVVTVVIDRPPVASFTSSCSGFTCTFNGSGSSDPDGTIQSYSWNFGDGAFGYGVTSSHTYAASGSYTATLTVIDNVGATVQTSHVVIVNQPPVASFTSSCSGFTCTFNGSASADPDGTIASYAWTFGDGATGSGVTSSHNYAAGGSYTATLTVIDNVGATVQTSHVVIVNQPPVASFTSSCSGFTCAFNGSGSSDPDGTIQSYIWNFGDGATGSGVTSSHTYAAGGSYAATLTVIDNAGATVQTSHVVIVNQPPVASFTSSCSGFTCTFNGSASADPDGTIASYAWTFGDGATGAGATANRTYASGGTYSVTLTVTDNAGATSTQVQSVTVATPAMHVGDLDGASTAQQNTWTAMVTLTIHTSSHQPLANAAVSASWSDGGTSSCTTNASGQCVMPRSGIAKKANSVMLTVTNVVRAAFVYRPADNHEPDGDSNGTAITVVKP